VGCCLSLLASQPLEVEELEETQVPFLHHAPYAVSTSLHFLNSQAGDGCSFVSYEWNLYGLVLFLEYMELLVL